MSKKRQWKDEHVLYNVTSFGSDQAQCMSCMRVLSNGSLKPALLLRHLKSHDGEDARPADVSKLDEMKAKRARFDTSATLPVQGFIPTRKPYLQASYEVAYRIAKDKKPHTLAENLIKPCAVAMARTVLDEKSAKKISDIPLSNNIIRQRIDELSASILTQTIDDLKNSPANFSLQLDESTDVANCSQLIAFVRYVKSEEIREEFLFCEELKTTSKAVDILNIVENFMQLCNISFNILGSICTDGAPVMLGNKSGFAELVKRRAPHVQVYHCTLHRHALASKTLTPSLKEAMNLCVKSVNQIRAKAKNHRLFKSFCQEVGADHDVLLLHTEVRWLSRGRVFTRVMELHLEMRTFFREIRMDDLADLFEDINFLLKVAYLADIFSTLNDLNVSIQGNNMNIVEAHEKLSAFLKKLPIWIRRVESGVLANFPTLEELVATQGELPYALQADIGAHLKVLQESFDKYFSALDHPKKWIRHPFAFNVDELPDDDASKELLIELQASEVEKMRFNTTSLEKFWTQLGADFNGLKIAAFEVLVPFVTTYRCELGFSAMLHLKTKTRNRLDLRSDMRVALSTIKPDIKKLVDNHQEQRAH